MNHSLSFILQFSWFSSKKIFICTVDCRDSFSLTILAPETTKDFQSILVLKGCTGTSFFKFFAIKFFGDFSFFLWPPSPSHISQGGHRVMVCHRESHQSLWQSLLPQPNAGWLMQSDTVSVTRQCHPERWKQTQLSQKHSGVVLHQK